MLLFLYTTRARGLIHLTRRVEDTSCGRSRAAAAAEGRTILDLDLVDGGGDAADFNDFLLTRNRARAERSETMFVFLRFAARNGIIILRAETFKNRPTLTPDTRTRNTDACVAMCV